MHRLSVLILYAPHQPLSCQRYNHIEALTGFYLSVTLGRYKLKLSLVLLPSRKSKKESKSEKNQSPDTTLTSDKMW